MTDININDERDVRLHKLMDLEEAGMPRFPAEAYRTHTVAAALAETHDATVQSTGRIMNKREIGKLTFGLLQDATGTIQLVFKQDEMPADVYKLFVKKADIGDIIEVSGMRMQTKNGEESIMVSEWRMLTKALLPLPDKFHGMQDEELRMRKRYLDLLTNDELRNIFVKKAKFWDVTRQFMKDNGFFEVQTPILETTTGGAEAAPFKTHHNDFDIDVFLRISVGELWQKRLMAAGFEKTFEIGPVFRNEGSSPDHLQEFTNMEFYWAYANYRDGMKLTQELYRTIATEVFGTTTFEHKGMTFDLADEWKEIDYVEEVMKQTGVDILSATEDDMRAKLDELGVVYEGENRERLMDTLWKYCRKHIAGPAFLIHHPKLVSPLSKSTPGNPEVTERFQIILAGSEVGNGFSELNDPIDQRERFEVQAALIERGDDEAMMPDWEFVEMLEHGMPPTCGFGFGERLFTFMVGKPIREATLFPLVKPLHNVPVVAVSEGEHSHVNGFPLYNELPLTRGEAWKLVLQHNDHEADLAHYRESEVVMRALAKRLNQDIEYWGQLGLLHDLDWGMTKEHSVEHCTKTPGLLRNAGYDEQFIQIILSHAYGTHCAGMEAEQRTQPIEYALACAETVTGLVYAAARIREDGIDSLNVSSLQKKFKNKKFAAGVDRNIVMECEQLGIPLDAFLQLAIDAIAEIKKEIGL